MYFNFRYDSYKASNLGKDILKLLSNAENSDLTSTDALQMFARLLIECDKCELIKLDYDESGA